MDNNGFKGRILIALAIALIAFLSYWSHTEQNPVTGQRQHIALSPSQEISLGLHAAPTMAREMGGEVSPIDPRAQEVRRIGELIITNSEAHKSPWKFQFHLLNDTKTINAFALPGGQIFITLGLYNNLQTEAQLAGVLSHEMGHVIERHTAQQMAKSQLGDMLVIAVGTGASDPNSGGGQNAAMIASVVNHMFQLRYSREDESEADIWGIKLMEKAGFDPTAMIQVMQILKSAAGSSHSPEMFQTHPNPDLRIEQIKAYLKEHPPAPGLTQGRQLKTGL